MNSHIDWNDARQGIEHLLDSLRPALSHDAVEAIVHYLTHDEYELALEGLLIESLSGVELSIDWRRCLELGQALGLDKETVLQHDLWQRLLERCANDSPPPPPPSQPPGD